MTRIEESNTSERVEDLEAEMSRLKRGLKRKNRNGLFSYSNCLIVVILFCFALFFLALFLLAKSGLREVPIFTEAFYHQPAPAYLVDSSRFSQADIVGLFKKEVEKTALAQKKTGDFQLPFSLTDLQLTALIKEKIAADEQLKQEVEQIQVAVLPDSLEIFFKQKVPSNLIITLNIVPAVIDEKLDFQVTKFKVGDLKIPVFAANFLTDKVVEKNLNIVLSSFSQYGRIEKITLKDKKIDLSLYINKIN